MTWNGNDGIGYGEPIEHGAIKGNWIMPYDPNHHHRQSIRLRGYDYTQPGAYFVTICTHQRQCLFDNPALRRVAEQQWQRMGHKRVTLDAWVVMPDHLHGIIVIINHGATTIDNVNDIDKDRGGFGFNVKPGSLGAIARSYKASVTRRVNQLQTTPGAPVWQRGYWERIVRDDREIEGPSIYR